MWFANQQTKNKISYGKFNFNFASVKLFGPFVTETSPAGTASNNFVVITSF